MNRWPIFSERLKAALTESGMTQKELARRSGCTEAGISRYLSGERIPTGPRVVLLANALGVSGDYLIGLADKPKAGERPSANLQPTCNRLATDCIHRQAAIDAIGNVSDYNDGMVFEALSHAQRNVSLLPAVIPEPSQIARDIATILQNGHDMRVIERNDIVRCKDCKYSDENRRRVSVKWLPCMDVQTGSTWFCGSAERKDGEADE